jgi:O-antigen biosynthesis protein
MGPLRNMVSPVDCNRGSLFDANYYRTGCGVPYERNDHWLNAFGLIADEIIRSLQPRTVFDAGCALGFLMESLWDRGVEARGIDLSSFAISQVRPDMQPYCRVASVTDPIDGRYNLVTCIEILEHVLPEETEPAIANLTSVTDTILFSSSPSDFNEPTHVNVRPVIGWLKLFAAAGFWPDCIFDASFVAPHAILLRRQDPLPDGILSLFSQYVRIKCALVEREQRIGALGQTIAELRQQLQHTGTELSAFLSKNAEMAGLIDSLSQALDGVRSELAASRKSEADLNETADSLRSELTLLAAELHETRRRSEEVQAEQVETRRALSKTQVTLPAQDPHLSSQLAAARADTRTWQNKAATMQTEAARLREELSQVYRSPAWRVTARYRGWLADQRRTSRWIRMYEQGANWLIRRGRLLPDEARPQLTAVAPADPVPDVSESAVETASPVFESYESWIARTEPSPERLELQRALSRQLRLQPLISVLVPVYKVPLPVLREMVESVLGQTYHNWQLCIAHGDLEDKEGREYLSSLAEREPRVRVLLLDRNDGIVGNSNAALQLVQGEYVALLDHDDTLAPFALFAIANAINEHPDAAFLYSDKDCLSEDGRSRLRPLFKPSWSPDIMLSVNYLTHLCVMRTDSVRAIGGWRSETEGAQDWDIFLRTIDRGGKVVFVPDVLYHWRIISTSVASGGLAAKPYAAKGQLQCLNDHAERLGLRAVATIDQTGRLKMDWQGASELSVSIILVSSSADPARMDDWAGRIDVLTNWPNLEIIAPGCSGSPAPPGRIRSTPFDPREPPSGRLNRAVKVARGDCLVFLDDSIEVGNADWLIEMIGPLQQAGVGLVGPKLLDPLSRNLRHAGLVFNGDGALDYIFSEEPEHICEQFGSGVWYRNWSAVAGACFAVRRDAFDQVGGFREQPAYPRHDVDLCLRIGAESGYRTFYNPFAVFSQSGTGLLENWLSADGPEKGSAYIRACFPSGDPYFHRQLESRGGKVLFASPKHDAAKLDYGAEARALVGLFDAPPDAIAASRAVTSKPPRNSVRSLTWVLPEFSHAFYGGVHTILRFADYFRRAHQVESEFVVLGSVPEPIMRSRLATAFPELAGSARFTRMLGYEDWDRVRPSDATISTLWTTAYAALPFRNTRRKFYFVQDYESLFYPAGSTYALVEATYKFGYYGLCNTRPLRDTYQEFGGEAEYFDPSIDLRYFFEAERKPVSSRPSTLFCYARPSHPRNCFELLGAALRLVKARMGDSIRIVSAGAEWAPSDYGLDGVVENLGLLGYSATGALYRTCDAGVVMMMTRHPSYLPMELMACGALVVTNQNRYTEWLLKNEENCLLTETSSGAVAAAIERGLRDKALRERIAARGAAFVRENYSDWDAQAEKIYRYMVDKS